MDNGSGNQAKRGPKSLEERTGEKTVMIKIMVTESQKAYLQERGVSTAAYIRRLVQGDMVIRQKNMPDAANSTVLTGLEMIIDSLHETLIDRENLPE
jgi:hypothetical protein